MSTVIAIWLPSKQTKRCPLDSDNDVLWLMSWKSFVVCDSWVSGAFWDISLQFISPNNAVQPGCAMIVVNYPAGIKPNDENCDKQKYVKVKMENSCQVGAGIIWQCLIISINNDYQNPSVTDPFWVSANDLSENWGTLYTNYIKLATRWIDDASGDPTYVDERCFENELIEKKKNTCIYRARETIDIWDAVATDWNWFVVRTDANTNLTRQTLCWIALNWWGVNTVIQVHVDWPIPINQVDWFAWIAIDWCVYISNTPWALTSTPPTTDCYPVWSVKCGKFYISHMWPCMSELQVLQRIKAIEDTNLPQCNIIVWNRNIQGFQWSFTFTSWWLWFVPRCADIQLWLRSWNFRFRDWLNWNQIIATGKIDWKMCATTSEVAWCRNIYDYPWWNPFAVSSVQPIDTQQLNWWLAEWNGLVWANNQEQNISIWWAFSWTEIQMPTTFSELFSGSLCFIIKARN